MGIELDTSKLDELQSQIELLEGAITQALADRMMSRIAAGWSAQGPSSAGEAPAMISGDLAASVKITDAGDSLKQVGSDLGYGRFLEFGTSEMAARPWLRPGVEQLRLEVLGLVREIFSGIHTSSEEGQDAGTQASSTQPTD